MRCRGDVGVTLDDGSLEQEHVHLDKYFVHYGFVYNPNAEIVKMSIEEYLAMNGDEVIGSCVLLSHVLEHTFCPAFILKNLMRAGLIVIVVPNSKVNEADSYDNNHIYSWTKASMNNLLMKTFRNADISVIPIEGGLDLMGVVRNRGEKD
jgi:hypothetical protein